MLLHTREDARRHGGLNGDHEAVERALTAGEPLRVGRFRFYIDGQRWEWSAEVERLHGYEPGTVTPTTDLVLSHNHPGDRHHVAAVLDKVLDGDPYSSRHRIIDTGGRTRWVIVVGDRMLDEAGNLVGTSGFYIDVTDTMQSDISTALSEVSEARAEIEQAKGVLMAAYGFNADRAFGLLVHHSQETNIKVRDLAHRFITAIAGSRSAETRRQVDQALLNISGNGRQ